MKTHSQKFLQQRRFYMALPLLVLPFITMIFWALGGGQGTPVLAQQTPTGLNTELPGAHFDKEDELWNKFDLYEQAKRDSLKYEEARRNDPYYVVATLTGNHPDTLPPTQNKLNTSLGNKKQHSQMAHQEQLIQQKLEQLSIQLNQPEPLPEESSTLKSSQDPYKNTTATPDEIEHLEKIMEMMASSDINDPEMEQIDDMLDKILDVQHPERVRERIKTQSLQNKQQVFPVKNILTEDPISLVDTSTTVSHQDTPEISTTQTSIFINGFFGLEEENNPNQEINNTIQAVVHDTQTVTNGSPIKLRLLADVMVNGQRLTKDQFVFGTCAINGERLIISINSIRSDNNVLPVALTLFDLDGIEGIYIPGALTRDVAKQTSNQSIQDIQWNTLDNSIGTQAAITGVEAAKGLFSKKAKLVKVTVKAGYQVLLQDTNAQQQ